MNDVKPEHIAEALTSAAEKASKPHGAIYVSPSTREGSTFQHALAAYGGPEHSELLKDGLRFGSALPALGTWADGAEESSLVETDPAITSKVGALLALKHKQKAIATFHPDEAGEGAQHIVEFQKPMELEGLYRELLRRGVQFSTFIPTDSNPMKIDSLHVLAGSPDESAGLAEKLRSLPGRQMVNRGHVAFPGADTREEAAQVFRQMLQERQV